ncbi:MAG: peptide ABC transporter substrate-binding protein [Chlamydiales bacterium]|nr:peptide ABC transporter substrate-binding protein [Chlamydiales bacterium]
MFLRILLVLCTSLFFACCGNVKRVPEQRLRLNLYCEPPTLDPRKFTDATSGNLLVMLFEGLTRTGFDHKPYPAAAEEILISKDKRTYIFKLRETYWSNGDRVTAEDFAYSWRKILDPKFPSPFAYKLYVIKNAWKIKEGKLPMEELGVRVIDEKTLEVSLNHPTPYFLELTGFPTFFPVNKRIDKSTSDWSADAGPLYVSNGPFKLKSWEHESEILVEKNPLYWDADSVNLESIHLSMIDDTTTEFYMYEMGELDWAGSPISNLPPEFIPALKEEGKIEISPATAVYYYKVNTDDPALSNQKIRQALALCVNRKEIVDHITQAEQEPALGIVPPMPGWKRSALYEDGDIERARHLFDQGLEEMGTDLKNFPTLTLSYNTNREHQKIAQAIQQQWKEGLGIKVELETSDWKVYLSKINKQNYQIARMGWVGDFHDPISFLEPFKYRDNPNIGGNNETGWEHPDFAAYLEKAEKEVDEEKRAWLLSKAEELLISEMPVIPIFYINFAYLKKPYVHGLYISSLGIVDFKKAYLEK